MIISPGYEKKEQKILDIFQGLSRDEQFLMVGVLHGFAHKNREKQIEQEYAARTCQKSAKIIQFPVAATR